MVHICPALTNNLESSTHTAHTHSPRVPRSPAGSDVCRATTALSLTLFVRLRPGKGGQSVTVGCAPSRFLTTLVGPRGGDGSEWRWQGWACSRVCGS
eukprot:m.43891 g.43891  ORF g.43891 m.43891 type:complete len:97 (+) comp14863_c0_seq1:63-353(+)